MTDQHDHIRASFRELERSFVAFERGERGRLYESRDAILALTEAIEQAGAQQLSPICEIASRVLGVLIMEQTLSPDRTVGFVRELLGHVEMTLRSQGGDEVARTPGGVFHVVNSERIGDLLVRKGLIGQEHLNQALVLQRVSNGKRVGEVLIAMNVIDQRTLESVLEDQRVETRRSESRRHHAASSASGGFQPDPLPPVPAAPGAPLPSIPLTGEALPSVHRPPYGAPDLGAQRLPEPPPFAAPQQHRLPHQGGAVDGRSASDSSHFPFGNQA